MTINLKVVGASWMKTRISLFIIIAASILCIASLFLGKIERPKYDGTYCATMYWTESTGFNIEYLKQTIDLQSVPQRVAKICYKDSIYENGWSHLEIETNGSYPDWVQAYAAGMLEGTLTWGKIYHHWSNVIQSPCDLNEKSQNFCSWLHTNLESNYGEVKKIAKFRANHDHYWHQIDLLINQLEGMFTGWQRGAKRSRSGLEDELKLSDFILLNSLSDIQDLKENYTLTIDDLDGLLNKGFPSIRGSMLLKLFLVSDKKFKFIMGHTTAGSYTMMLRMQKRYSFNFHVSPINLNTNTVPGLDIQFSGYPGIISSLDDFYVIKGRNVHSVIGGVAIRNENPNLWQNINANYQIPVSFRIMTTNRLGQNRKLWEKNIKRYAVSGSKQWIRVDLKLIRLLQKLYSNKIKGMNFKSFDSFGLHDIINLSEQVVNKFKSEDLTPKISVNWSSIWCYGVPRQEEIRTLSRIFNENDMEKFIDKNITSLEDIDVFLRKNAFRGDLLGEQSFPYGNIDIKLFVFDPSTEKIEYSARSGPLFTEPTKHFAGKSEMFTELSLSEVNDSIQNSVIESTSTPTIPIRSIRNDMLAIAKSRDLQSRPFKWSDIDDTGVNHQGQPNEWHFPKIQPKWAWNI